MGVTANPKLSQAKRGVELCKENGVDMLIALGGGSAIDCTKVIAASVYYAHDMSRMLMLSHSDVTAIPPTRALPYIAIPTLAGTGSEMNPIGVITDDESGKKSYVWEPGCLYAKVAVMDPGLTTSLPSYQTACGGYDKLHEMGNACRADRPCVDANGLLYDHFFGRIAGYSQGVL